MPDSIISRSNLIGIYYHGAGFSCDTRAHDDTPAVVNILLTLLPIVNGWRNGQALYNEGAAEFYHCRSETKCQKTRMTSIFENVPTNNLNLAQLRFKNVESPLLVRVSLSVGRGGFKFTGSSFFVFDRWLFKPQCGCG